MSANNILYENDTSLVAQPNPCSAECPTPEALVDRFRRQGLFDTLRRDLMKEFQSSDSKSKFEAKLRDIVLDKLAYDERRRKNDRGERLRGQSLSATKERHEDVLKEIERHALYDRTINEIEARYVDNATIKNQLYDLLDESRPASKRRKFSQSGNQSSATDYRTADKQSTGSTSTRLVTQNLSQTLKDIAHGTSTSDDLDGLPIIVGSTSLSQAERHQISIDGYAKSDARDQEVPPRVPPDHGHQNGTTDQPSSSAVSLNLDGVAVSPNLDGLAVSPNLDGTPDSLNLDEVPEPLNLDGVSISSHISVESASRLAIEKTSASRRPSIRRASVSTPVDSASLPFSSVTDRSSDPHPQDIPCRTLSSSSSSASKNIQSTPTLSQRLSISTNHSNHKSLSSGVTVNQSATSERPKSASQQAVAPSINPSDLASGIDSGLIDSAVTEILQSFGPSPRKTKSAEEEKSRSAPASELDGEPLVDGEPLDGGLLDGEPLDDQPLDGELLDGEPLDGESFDGELIAGASKPGSAEASNVGGSNVASS